jgi:hypothetical protein
MTSCPSGNIGIGNCETEDSILSENVIDLDIKYFALKVLGIAVLTK